MHCTNYAYAPEAGNTKGAVINSRNSFNNKGAGYVYYYKRAKSLV